MRAAAIVFSLLFSLPAKAQTPAGGQKRVYVQQLEDQGGHLNGENERLTHELNQLRAGLGQPPIAPTADQTGAVTVAPAQAGAQTLTDPATGLPLGPPPQDLGTASVS